MSELAGRLAVEAGEILRKGQHTARAAVADTKSSAADIVTELDRESEAHIVDAIRAARPHDSILGEEGSSIEGTSGVRWVIDPLDGTVNFTYGIPQYAVSIGVEVDGVRTIGVVFNPASDEMWHAVKGVGATLNGTRIETKTPPPLSNALVATGFGYVREMREQQAEVLRRLLPSIRDIRRMGAAALDLCAVASGRVDAYFELNVNPWDVCAGDVIASEAGAIVTAFERETALRSVLAARDPLHRELQQAIA